MENLSAVYSQTTGIKTLSSQEFQEMLNMWFEEKGVLTELRLQLRFKLVNLLKDTIIGKDICKRNSKGTSLFNQAINLIVAEYLMHNKCFYSLSIFNSEATFTNILPKGVTSNERVGESDLYKLHFDRENVLQILEIIGVSRNSQYCDKLLNMYFNEHECKSFLSCLITLLYQLPSINAEINDTSLVKHLQAICADSCDEINFLVKIEDLLNYVNLPSEYAKKVTQNIQSYYQLKKEQDQKELLALIDRQKDEITSKDKKITELRKSKNILQSHLLKTNKNYKKARSHLANLLSEENLLKRNLSLQNVNIDCPDVKCSNLIDRDVKPNISEVLIPENTSCRLPHCTDVCIEDKKRIEDLLSENSVLKKENKEQKESLKKLFYIYKDVLRKLNNCQNELNLINSRVGKGLNEGLFSDFLNGGNLENLEVLLQPTTDGTDVSSESLTEEILHQARVKLQRLEEETKEIEDKFRQIHCT